MGGGSSKKTQEPAPAAPPVKTGPRTDSEKAEIKASMKRRTSMVAKILSDEDLQAALRHPEVLGAMGKFLERNFCAENLLFYAHVDELKKLEKTDPLYAEKFDYIIREFVVENSPQQVNIKATARTHLLDETTTKNPEIFDEAQKEAFLMIRTNNWVPFTESEEFHTLAEGPQNRFKLDLTH